MMNLTYTLILLSLFISTLSFSQERGDSGPPIEKFVSAKVFNSDSLEVTDQACAYLNRIDKLQMYYDTNSNEGTTKLNWVIELDEGDYLELDLRFAVYGTNFSDPTGFIRMKEGELTSFYEDTYSLSSTSNIYQSNGFHYIATIEDEAKIAIAGLWKTILIQVKRKKKELDDPVDLESLVSQVANSNIITVNFDSNQEEEIYLYSAQGDLVNRFEALSGSNYDLSNHRAGVYFIRANVNGEVLTGKCVKF